MGDFLAGVPDAVWGGLALVVGAVATGWLANRGKKPESTSTFIDDLMGRIAAVEQRLTATEQALDTERAARQTDREDFRQRLLAKDRHIDVLMEHIRTGQGPPPPVWPIAATREAKDA